MSRADPPPLPDGLDAYEILEVARDADEMALKRAYTGKIRTYRPDRSPLEFQRVRAAYEEALDRLHHRAFYEAIDQGQDIDQDPDAAPAVEGRADPEAPSWAEAPEPEPATSPCAAIWTQAAEGRHEDALGLLERQQAQRPSDLEFHATRFLLREARGEDDQAYSELASAFERSPGLARWTWEVLDAEELERVSRQAHLTLNRIVRQRHADAAETLASCRAQALIRDLALETLLREAADPIVRRQARGDSRFASLLLRIACATAWSHPDEADEIFQNAASGSSESTWLEVAYDIRVRTRDVYEQWRGHFPKTTVLDRFLRIFDSLEPDALEVERGRLAASARARPVEYAEALAALWADEEHELPVHLLEGLGAGDELEEEDDHEDEVLEPLGPREREMMRAALHATDKALGRDFGNTLSSLALGGIIVGTIYLFGAQGAWGWAGVAALIAWILVGLSRSDRGLYARIIRPQLAKLVARTSCTPAEILQELKVVTKLSDDVGRFQDEIAEDAGLELLSRILRINR